MITKITCPLCGHVQDIEVPEDACLQFYKCDGCNELIQAPEGFCCVICAYSEIKCPVSVRSKD